MGLPIGTNTNIYYPGRKPGDRGDWSVQFRRGGGELQLTNSKQVLCEREPDRPPLQLIQ